MKSLRIASVMFILVFGFNSCKTITENEPKQPEELPNIILVMADDLGWGDVAYNGNKTVKTPHLDQMAAEGLKLNRFYAAAPVCSPTRASALTGRHPYRVKIPWAGDGFIHPNEVTIAEMLKIKGYATGHFGKWHVGGLSKSFKQSYFPGPITTYSPPWENGFDVSFSTESMMPTYNPYYHVGGNYGEEDYKMIQTEAVGQGQETGGHKWRDVYWTGPGQFLDNNPGGDDAELVMDKALEFIKEKVETQENFLSLIWFHNVHTPVVAGNKHRELYKDLTTEEQHWYGGISAMDDQIGRLRAELKIMGISENTIIWFCSDNGPSYVHDLNSAGPYRGKKSELLEGGIIVPSIVEWPAKFKSPASINTPMVTSDFFPTLLEISGVDWKGQAHIDGEDVLSILMGDKTQRERPIGFRSPLPSRLNQEKTLNAEQWAYLDQNYKLISMDNGKSYQLYDLSTDVQESKDLSEQLPDYKQKLLEGLLTWSRSIDTELEMQNSTYEE
ncbi:sulfatase-like hydrolase/transferase [Maribacter ulvicola]|uniref:Arylsulfatase A n=1 Tax=Maribacter ulvicola TaxID=228959 RepID=A0A1N6X9V5_9FLAO|nr:sulfatase-like hydrolase/transferase [Maribacter ulvicola]SIQ99128.1 Arylsulfatase A [Maribacter ulvicola]